MTERPEWLAEYRLPEGLVFREAGQLWANVFSIATAWRVPAKHVRDALEDLPFNDEFLAEHTGTLFVIIEHGEPIGMVRNSDWQGWMLHEVLSRNWAIHMLYQLTERGLRYSMPLLREFAGCDERGGAVLWDAFAKEQAVLDQRRRT